MPSMPDITKAQVAGIIATLAAVANLFNLDISPELQAGLTTGIISFYVVAHIVADAILRKGRAGAVAAVENANAAALTAAAPTGVVALGSLSNTEEFQTTAVTQLDEGDEQSRPGDE